MRIGCNGPINNELVLKPELKGGTVKALYVGCVMTSCGSRDVLLVCMCINVG